MATDITVNLTPAVALGVTIAGTGTAGPQGTVATATNTETLTGTDATKAVTPAGLRGVIKVIDVRSYGAVADNATISTAAIQSAANAAAAIVTANADAKVTLWFPDGGPGYRTDGTVTVAAGVQVWMDAPIWCASTAAVPILTIGTAASLSTGNYRLAVRRTVSSDWLNEGQVGLKLVNIYNSDIDIRMASYNTIGVLVVGNTKGWVHNIVRLAEIGDNKYGLVTDAIASGWVNDNQFHGGNWQSSSSTDNSKSRYGVTIRSSDGTYPAGSNNNLFVKPSIEIASLPLTGGAEAVAFDFPAGSLNRVISARVECPYLTWAARFSGMSSNNEIEIGFSSFPVGTMMQDSTTARSNVVDDRSTHLTRRGYPIYQSPPLHQRITSWDGPDPFYYHLPDIEFYDNAGVRSRNGLWSNIVSRDDHIELTATGAIAVRVDTTVAKRFRLDTDVFATGGRYAVQPYNAAGAVIDGSVTAVVNSSSGGGVLSWSASNGGRHTRGSDMLAGYNQEAFVVADSVKSIAVMFLAGTANMKLRQFRLYSLDVPNVAVWSLNSDVGRVSTMEPVAGQFARNEHVRNDATNGGWRTVTAGTATGIVWAASTAYAVTAIRYNGANAYRVTVAGTSAASGGPTGTGTAIVDGTVTWKYAGVRATFVPVDGSGTTALRPAAATVGVGAMYYDTTLVKPIWSNGTVWKDATGVTV